MIEETTHKFIILFTSGYTTKGILGNLACPKIFT